jgi:small subunit ribosomal protein S9
MADEPTPNSPEEPSTEEPTTEPVAQEPTEEVVAEVPAEEPAVEVPAETPAEEAVAANTPAEEAVAAETPAEEPAAEQSPVAEEPTAAEPVVAEEQTEEPGAEEPSAEEPVAESDEEVDEEDEEPKPRVKPSVPGAHLEVDIVPEGVDPLAPEQPADPYAVEDDEEAPSEEESESSRLSEPISTAAIDLAAGARYKATGKRKTAIARVILKPGTGTYLVNGRTLDEHFPRVTLQRNIRQPLETVGYQERMDVIARLHGGGISAQAGALRHGISRALLEADPNLRGELKRRGFLTRDSRAKERKKAGLKKARKRPQFSKR